MIDSQVQNVALQSQKNEITEHIIYKKLAEIISDLNNKKILVEISNDELKHYNFWKNFSQKEVKPSKFQIWKYYLVSRIFGVIFGLKLMEKGEENAQEAYAQISKFVPDVKQIIKDEEEHEQKLLALLNEDKIKYIGSMVLGINDALVELTGALAGLTFAFQDTHLIATAGLITGVAAALSMGASEFLSQKAEQGDNPFRASIYTGGIYMMTVVFLIMPYLLFHNLYLCLGSTILIAILIIFLFNYYISVIQDTNFRKNFLQMAIISLGVAGLSFVIGYLIRIFFGVNI